MQWYSKVIYTRILYWRVFKKLWIYNLICIYHSDLTFRSLHLSNISFANLEDLPIIHAQQLDTVTLDSLMMPEGTLKLLIVTHQDESMNLISITNSNIDKLGEINISPRRVSTVPSTVFRLYLTKNYYLQHSYMTEIVMVYVTVCITW